MSESSTSFTEVLSNSVAVNVNIWKDTKVVYMTYNIPAAGLENASERT